MSNPSVGGNSGMDGFDPARGTHVRGIQLTPTSFVAVTNFNQLQTITRHPADLQPGAKRTGYDAEALAEEAEVHELIQRALTGSKKLNVAKYSTYIEEVVTDVHPGVLPPIHLWSREPLDVVQVGTNTFAVIPNAENLPSIDGETQLASHYELQRRVSPEVRKVHGTYPLAVIIHHGVPTQTAQLYFHDLNVLAVRPNVSLGLSMNPNEPLMFIVNELEQKLPFLTGRIERQRRQLAKNSPKVITTQSLRQMVINVGKGVSGVQYGARPAPMEDVDLNDLEKVATEWFRLYFDTFGAEVVDRQNSMAGSPAILAAIGAIGQQVLKAAAYERPALMASFIDSLRKVDWRKGDHWVGIAGSMKPSGFSVGGTKEVAYTVYNVLADAANPGYARVRHAAPAAGAIA